MPWYKCSIVGENFPGIIFGEGKDFGFYITRFVEASSVEEAEMLALNNLKQEPVLSLPANAPKPTSARVTFEDIVEIDSPENPVVQPGFCFFEMNS